MTDAVYGFIIATVFIVIGSVALVRPERLQRSAQKNTARLPIGNLLGIRAFAHSSSYVPIVRVLGLMSILAGLFLVAGLVAERIMSSSP